MKNLVLPYLLSMAVSLVFNFVNAQELPTISIQGTLKDANGSSVSDGTYAVVFRLFNQESGGNPVWQEEATVEVVGGIYSHYLGSINPLSSSDFGSTLFLGLKVGNFELNPRTRMTYAPYTLAAATAVKVVCSGALGDVKYSILNPTKFAEENGDCWVPMDGRSIAGSRLAAALGVSNVPDVGGLFLRSQEFPGSPDNDPGRNSNSAIATVQAEELKSHGHGVNDPGHLHSGGSGQQFYLMPVDNAGLGPRALVIDPFLNLGNPYTGGFGGGSASTGISINNSGGTETRPKNLNLWTYIRIN